jgi:signal transduction histidine kinase
VRLKRKWSRRIPHILLDEKQLEEAFLNFILNALDAMPGGGTLMINANLDFQTNDIIVSFLDTGCGINPENLNRLFTPFFSTKEEGVGLGLALAYQIISSHKGRINIESKLGQGTEIVVRLPFQRETDKEKQGSNHGNNPDS